jgi:hypothetical protein
MHSFAKQLVAALVLAALCAAVPASATTGAPVAAAKKHRKHRRHVPKSACQKLTGHDYAPSKQLKLVAHRSTAIETDLGACELPRGQVRYYAIRVQAGNTNSDFAVHSVSGRLALISTQSSSPYGADSRTWVVDIAGGRILYEISNWRCMVSAIAPCAPEPPEVMKGFVDRIGKSLIAFDDGGTVTIAGFGTDGHRKNYDSGPADDLPASSLGLKANVASWLHSGEERGGVLP